MTTETLTCPYCNASIGVSAGLPTGQRIVCPRCGDAFAPRPADAFTGQPAATVETAIADKPTTTASPAAPRPELSLRSRRSLGIVATVVIGVMLLMAGAGLTFMLTTQQQRRAYDTSRPPRRPGKQRGVPEPELPPIIAAVAPDKLAALGYLPASVNVLLGARVPELLASPAGVRILRDPVKLGDADYRLEDLPAWIGFRLEDIDHFVFAARVDESLIPPFYLVLRTAQPYDEDQLRQRLKGTRVASPSKKKLYSFHALRQGMPLFSWFVDERTVVLALFADQLESLPLRPVEDLRQFSEEIRIVLKQRREPAAPAWIAGHSRDWNKTSAAKILNRMKKENQRKLTSLRSFGIWLVPDESLAVKGVFACKDEAGARELEKYFRSLHGPDANFTTALDGAWLTLQFHTSCDFLARLMKR